MWHIIQTNAPYNSEFGQLTTAKIRSWKSIFSIWSLVIYICQTWALALYSRFALHSFFINSLFFLLSAIAPKMKVRSRAIERFQRAMRPALTITVYLGPGSPDEVFAEADHSTELLSLW